MNYQAVSTCVILVPLWVTFLELPASDCTFEWLHGPSMNYVTFGILDIRVVSNSNAIRAHSHSHPWLDLERRESIRECELNEIVLTNPKNPHSAHWIGTHNVAHSKINSNVNSKLNWVECASVDSTLNGAHLCHWYPTFLFSDHRWSASKSF